MFFICSGADEWTSLPPSLPRPSEGIAVTTPDANPPTHPTTHPPPPPLMAAAAATAVADVGLCTMMKIPSGLVGTGRRNM